MTALTPALSAALIHFVWQGALVGCALRIALVALQRRSATARYGVSCAALGVLVLAFVLTVAAVLHLQARPTTSSVLPTAASPHAVLGIPATMLPLWIAPDVPPLHWLARVQIWALPIWSMGVLFFSVRLALGCAQAGALGRRGEPPDASLLAMMAVVARRMHVGRPVRVLLSTVSDGPSVLGWLRPVILVPPAAVMGLTPQQLEAVLAHELAHIKRHDYLVNVLQGMAESLLFYHPVVWWISKQIRIERELCCDDLAVRSCGDALGYARALTTLARLRLTTPTLAMGSTGGSLLYRIQRLVDAPPQECRPTRWSGVLALCLGLASVGLAVNWAHLFAQTGTESPRFEVASVKPNKSGDGTRGGGFQPGGRFLARNMPLRNLIAIAYGEPRPLPNFQISGGPDWIDSDRFDIEAKAAGNFPETQAEAGFSTSGELMLRALLVERFKLTVHKEVRQLPVYALLMARSDGRPGPQLKPSSGEDCAKAPSAGGLPGSPNPDGLPRCGVYQYVGGTGGNVRHARVRFMTMEQLAKNLENPVGRIVLNRTGLAGTFSFDLEFAPGLPTASPDVAVNDAGSSIFTALQEQLGLKLESTQGPVDVLVIDSASQLEPN